MLVFMQAAPAPEPGSSLTHPYTSGMARKLERQRPKQGARLAALRRAAGLTQTELAQLVGESQQNIAFWEQSEKPPRSDVLPKMAKVLGVRIEQMLEGELPETRRAGPVGKVQKIFEQVSILPRRQQDRIIETVSALVAQYKRGV
jgi:transcriptional regulator with XRE-family HTH domain